MKLFQKLRVYMDNNPRLKPYLLMWLRRTTKTINKWPKDKFVKGVMECYERHMGYTFDLNHPVLFNEKLQWYKIYYQRDDFGLITDKVTFKDFIQNKLGDGYTVPMYGWWDNIKDFEKAWKNLPNSFVLKSNLSSDSRGIIFIKDKSTTNYKEIREWAKYWLVPRNTLINSWDWRFYNSTPKILAEKLLEDKSGDIKDFKFFCFRGYVPYFKVDYGRQVKHHANYYNAEMVELEVEVSKAPKDKNVHIDMPPCINDMFRISSELSKDMPFVRTDFFICNDKMYIAELTFASGGGIIPYPYEFNKVLGDLLVLPTDN